MLKYLYVKEVFKEVPSEISLGISISGCRIRCRGCHSRELWEDRGVPLTTIELDRLLSVHEGITCVLFLGGEHDIDILTSLCTRVKKAHPNLLTAWYCGLDKVPENKKEIYLYLDWIKLGHYDSKLGGLDSPTTNQRLYRVLHRVIHNEYSWNTIDVTKSLRKHNQNQITTN